MNENVSVAEFWRTIGQRATGATVVTALGQDGPSGFLGLSATHVEADPPTMLVAISKKTSALADILSSVHFAVNYLPYEAAPLVDAFSGKTGVTGADRFRNDEWATLVTGAPVLRSALGVFDCRLEETIDRGNVVLVIGRVAGVAARESGSPLILFRGATMAVPA